MLSTIVAARRRVLRQLLEALIFEGILQPEPLHGQREGLYWIEGIDRRGDKVTYEFAAVKRFTFEMLRLTTDEPVMRREARVYSEAGDPSLFLDEVFHKTRSPYPVVALFYEELERTLIHEIRRLDHRRLHPGRLQGASLHELECRASDGHPYHPCFRSRIGFSQEDNETYSPEYEPEQSLYWLAVRRENTSIHLPDGLPEEELYRLVLAPQDLERFSERIRELGLDISNYRWVPVHPWQWEYYLKPRSSLDLNRMDVIPLGPGSVRYMPQQSIRTWSCRNALLQGGTALSPDIKLSLHIMNTSSLRDLTEHSVAAAPAVSSWLQSVVDSDPYLKNEAGMILLKEFASINYLPFQGAASCIWRENIEAFLKPDEEAVPFYVLSSNECDGTAYIDPWINKYGLKEWFTEWVRQTMIPVVHLLVAHGLVLESHAQNMIMVHQDGWPVRVALRDFHEGVEYTRSYLTDPGLLPDFSKIHIFYAQGRTGDHFEMPLLKDLREMMIDCLWFMNAGYFIMYLADRYSVTEQELWRWVSAELETYVDRFPHLRDRFAELELLTPTCEIEPLAQKKLYGRVIYSPRSVPNPLHEARWLEHTDKGGKRNVHST